MSLQGMRGSLGNWPTYWHFLGIITFLFYNNGKSIYYWDCSRKSKNYGSHNHVDSFFLSGSLWMWWDRNSYSFFNLLCFWRRVVLVYCHKRWFHMWVLFRGYPECVWTEMFPTVSLHSTLSNSFPYIEHIFFPAVVLP